MSPATPAAIDRNASQDRASVNRRAPAETARISAAYVNREDFTPTGFIAMQTVTQAPPPATPAQTAPVPVVVGENIANAEYRYDAARAVQRELRGQLESLVEQRHGLLRELEDHDGVPGPARTGMEQRIVQLDQRIAEVDKAIATADADVARTAAVPGAVVIQPQPPVNFGPPDEAFIVGMVMMAVVFLPISLAFARRLWRRGTAGAAAAAALPRELMERLGRLEQMGESTAVEVERIGEGQRFVTRLLTERGDRVLTSKSP